MQQIHCDQFVEKLTKLFWTNFLHLFKNFILEKMLLDLLGDPVVTEIQAQAEDVISNEVLPAFKLLQVFIESEYINHLRPAPGIRFLPQGPAMYQAYLDYHTGIAGITPGKNDTRLQLFKPRIGF